MLILKKVVGLSFLILLVCASVCSTQRVKVFSTNTSRSRVLQPIVEKSNIFTANYLMDMIDDDLSNENHFVFTAISAPANSLASLKPANYTGSSNIPNKFSKTKLIRSESSFLMNFRI